MNRRNFIGTGALAGAGALVLSQVACGPNIDTEIGIVLSTIPLLKPLLPNQVVLLDKIASVTTDLRKAYKAGDFNSAKNFFGSLDTNIQTLINDVGGASPRVQFLVALVGVAVHAIAALLNEQPAPVTATATAMAPDAVDRLKVLGSAEAAAKALASVKQ
jgi:hypothetical protein